MNNKAAMLYLEHLNFNCVERPSFPDTTFPIVIDTQQPTHNRYTQPSPIP